MLRLTNEAERRLELTPDLWRAGWHFLSHLGGSSSFSGAGIHPDDEQLLDPGLICCRVTGNVLGTQRFVLIFTVS